MRRPRLRTSDDRYREGMAEVIADEWDKLPNSIKADLIVEVPALYFAMSGLARWTQVGRRRTRPAGPRKPPPLPNPTEPSR